jgi:hypothetical protein
MARTPTVPRRPAGRPLVVPPVVPEPVVDLQPVDDNPPVIDDEVPVPVLVDVPVVEAAVPGEIAQMREEMRAMQNMLQNFFQRAPQAAAGVPPPPPPPFHDTIAALMLCGFDEAAASALSDYGMNSIDNLSVMDAANFLSLGAQVTRYHNPLFQNRTPVLPIPAMNSLKGMCMWAAYHKARNSTVTMRDFTQEVHDAFLARYLEMRTEESRDHTLMQSKLVHAFPKNFTSTHFITTEKNLRAFLETQRSPFSKTPLSYLLRAHDVVDDDALNREYASIDEELINTHLMDGDEFIKDSHTLFDLWTIIISADHSIASFRTDPSIRGNGRALYLKLKMTGLGEDWEDARLLTLWMNLQALTWNGKSQDNSFEKYIANSIDIHNECSNLKEPVKEYDKCALFIRGIQAESLQPFIDSLPSRSEMYKSFNKLYDAAKQALIQSADNKKRGSRSSSNQNVSSVQTKKLKRTPVPNSPKAAKAAAAKAAAQKAAKVVKVWPPPNYWKPPPDHNPGLVWDDHPEGGKGNGMIKDGASDKKSRPIEWITDPTANSHYTHYNDMYIAQQVRVHEFRKANAKKRKEALKKAKANTRNTSAVSSELIPHVSSTDSSEIYPRNVPGVETDPSVPKDFYGPNDDDNHSESSDSIFDRSTDEDMDMKPAAIDISGMVVDEVRNIGATFTEAIPTPIIGVPELPGRNASYAEQHAFYLLHRKANPSMQRPPIPPPRPPPILPVRIVKLNLMPVVPGLPESGMIASCSSWPADAEDGRHIQQCPLDRSISIHKRSERQLRHIVFHYRRLYRDTIDHLNYIRPNGYWTSWETREELDDKVVDPARIQSICQRMDIIGRPLSVQWLAEEIQLSRKIRGYDSGEWDDDPSHKTFCTEWYERNKGPNMEAYRRDWFAHPYFQKWNIHFEGYVKPVGDPILRMEDGLDHTNDN